MKGFIGCIFKCIFVAISLCSESVAVVLLVYNCLFVLYVFVDVY